MAPVGLLAAAVLAAVASLAAHLAPQLPHRPGPVAARFPLPTLPTTSSRGWRSWAKGSWTRRRTCTWTRRAGGAIYTATRDGWIQRMRPGANASWERWRFVGGTGLLGIAPSADGTMLRLRRRQGAAESRGGRSDPPCLGGRGLPDQVRGRRDRGLRRHGLLQRRQHQVRLRQVDPRLPRESRPSGRLLKYDPRTGETSVVLDRLGFANGVARPSWSSASPRGN
ncbi:hypothetical protein PR202_gb21622 [Eleusine coracana subsp. coracana]|uniref:Strictosidine synthase conserved region domain-containing protein n=1 Tax=Eleusine coracana subsp. coracana TaxID=191504 RepID=A0AAV5FDV9_ELECO|nr:hypothetical protein PR202_gb21622 [Eleusine coracana subsp. coracana]